MKIPPQEMMSWVQTCLAAGNPPETVTHFMLKGGYTMEQAASFLDMCRQASNFLAQPPRIVRSGNVVRTTDRIIPIAVWMDSPLVVVFDNVLSAEECELLIMMSKDRMQRSTILDVATGGDNVDVSRTSSGMFFEHGETPLLVQIEKRMAELLNWPNASTEGLQMLRYEVGEEYRPHYDFFEPTDPGSVKSLAIGGQRTGTLLLYLSEVEEGGETHFPNLNLRVAPRVGSAVYFEYHNYFHQLDRRSLHAGLPVVRGTKWVATKWLRERIVMPPMPEAQA